MKRITHLIAPLFVISFLTSCNNVKTYSVIFDTDGGTQIPTQHVPENKFATKPDNPTKEGTAELSYHFDKWKLNDGDFDFEHTPITQDITIKATYTTSINHYDVEWVDGDNKVIHTDKDIEYNKPIPNYDGPTPTKTKTAQYTYSFKGWDKKPEIDVVLGKTTVRAQFTATTNTYEVKFENDDGTVLETENVAYGNKATYHEAEPTKEATAQYTYTFNGWDKNPETTTIVGPTVFKATYKSTLRKYKITFSAGDGVFADGKKSFEKEFNYGTAPAPDTLPLYFDQDGTCYGFKSWSPEVVKVVGEATYVASYSSTALSQVKMIYRYHSSGASVQVAYSGTVSAINWGDGTVNKMVTHTYAATTPENTQITLYGNITSFSLSNSNGPYKTGNNYITSIEIPGSVYAIPQYAFYKCSELASVTIKSGVTSIGDSAFSWCEKLSNISVPDTVTYMGKDAFRICAFSTFTIPSGVTSLNDNLFRGVEELETLVIPEGITHIGSGVFSSTGIKNLTMPTTLRTVAAHGLSGTHATSLVIPDNTITTVEEGALGSNPYLKELTIPEGVTSIAYRGLEWGYMYKVKLPSTLTSIGERAFFACNALDNVVIPKKVESIGDAIFIGCNGLKNLSVDNENPNFDSRNNCNAIINSKTNVLIAGCRSTVVPEGVVGIGNEAFRSAQYLETMELPSTIKWIGDYAFSGCLKITNLKLNEGLESIGENAFSSCEAILSVIIPSTVSVIKSQAFSYNTKMTDIYIPLSSKPSGWVTDWNGNTSAVEHWNWSPTI